MSWFMLIQMKSVRLLALFLTVLALGGCRQPDGAMPVPAGDDPGRITDLMGDLDSISRGDADGQESLTEDLLIFTQGKPQADAAVKELGTRTAAALKGRSLADEPTKAYANQLYLTVRAWRLSERQVKTLQTDVQTTLTSGGIPMEAAQPIVDQVAEVQRAVNETPRRWYQWF
jgi:hypothetical protein